MNDPVRPQQIWTSSQAFTFWGICAVIGVVIGYLLHSPAPTVSTAHPSVQQMPAATGTGGAEQITAEQLKHMADKKAEPLLAQLEKNPKDAKLLSEIGSVYLAAHQSESARDYFERSVRVKADPAVLTQLSAAYYFCNDIDKSIAALHQVLDIDPRNATALYNLGMLEWRVRSDPNAAIAAWEKFLQVNPNDPSRAQVEQLLARARRHQKIAPGTRTDKPAL